MSKTVQKEIWLDQNRATMNADLCSVIYYNVWQGKHKWNMLLSRTYLWKGWPCNYFSSTTYLLITRPLKNIRIKTRKLVKRDFFLVPITININLLFSFVAMRDGEWAFGALYCSVNSFTSCFTVTFTSSSSFFSNFSFFSFYSSSISYSLFTPLHRFLPQCWPFWQSPSSATEQSSPRSPQGIINPFNFLKGGYR